MSVKSTPPPALCVPPLYTFPGWEVRGWITLRMSKQLFPVLSLPFCSLSANGEMWATSGFALFLLDITEKPLSLSLSLSFSFSLWHLLSFNKFHSPLTQASSKVYLLLFSSKKKRHHERSSQLTYPVTQYCQLIKIYWSKNLFILECRELLLSLAALSLAWPDRHISPLSQTSPDFMFCMVCMLTSLLHKGWVFGTKECKNVKDVRNERINGDANKM